MLKLNFPAGTLLQNRFLDNRPPTPFTWTPALSCQIVDDVSLNFGSENSITKTPWSTITREPASKLTNRGGVHSNNAQRVVLGAAEILLLEKHFGFHINFFPFPFSWFWFGTLLFILHVVHGIYYLHSRPTNQQQQLQEVDGGNWSKGKERGNTIACKFIQCIFIFPFLDHRKSSSYQSSSIHFLSIILYPSCPIEKSSISFRALYKEPNLYSDF